MSNTFGDFVVAAALGDVRRRTMTPEEARRARQERCEAVGPMIQVLRAERRKAESNAMIGG